VLIGKLALECRTVTRKSENSVFAIVLAAGSSSRFGSSKQLVELDGETLIRRADNLAQECCDSRRVLVTGHEWRAVLEACAPTSGFVLLNERHKEGIGTSIATAVRALRHAADAVIVMLADQPLISSDHINALVDAWSGADQEIVATAYADTVGVPALFASGCFDALAVLEGDRGARALIAGGHFPVREVVFQDAAVDIDTADDLARLARNARN
jgi:molybdenum cofactor cytidylyltransferase